jgi:hypothetical protein
LVRSYVIVEVRRRTYVHKASIRWVAVALVALGGVLAGCGDDDSGGDPLTSAGSGGVTAPDDASAGGSDELALGDPCVLVPPSAVAGIVGGEVTGELVNVDDGLPGATCAYTVASGGSVSLSITPDGAGFYSGYRDQADDGGIEDVDGLGDEGFVFQDVEVVARSGDAMIQLQVFTSSTTADTGGVEVVRLAIDAINA